MDFAYLITEEIDQMKNQVKEKHYKNTDLIVVRNLTPVIRDFIIIFNNVHVFLIYQ